jgi:hypothetical protein
MTVDRYLHVIRGRVRGDRASRSATGSAPIAIFSSAFVEDSTFFNRV